MSDSLAELSRQLMDVKSNISNLNSDVKNLTTIKVDLELRLIAGMNAIGQDQIRNPYGTFSLAESTVPSDIDWEIFHNWIIEHNVLHILQRRVSIKEYSDMIAMGETIPGVTPFNKITLKTLKRK